MTLSDLLPGRMSTWLAKLDRRYNSYGKTERVFDGIIARGSAYETETIGRALNLLRQCDPEEVESIREHAGYIITTPLTSSYVPVVRAIYISEDDYVNETDVAVLVLLFSIRMRSFNHHRGKRRAFMAAGPSDAAAAASVVRTSLCRVAGIANKDVESLCGWIEAYGQTSSVVPPLSYWMTKRSRSPSPDAS